MPHAAQFDQVTVLTKANVYFDGKVISHTVLFKDQKKKSVGVVLPGTFKFNTEVAERMDITAGQCRVKLAGASEWKAYGPGTSFSVPAKSHFEIAVDQGAAEYICSFE